MELLDMNLFTVRIYYRSLTLLFKLNDKQLLGIRQDIIFYKVEKQKYFAQRKSIKIGHH